MRGCWRRAVSSQSDKYLSDKYYRDPAYEELRELVGAWITCGGTRSLAAHFEVPLSTVERWYRGTAAPHPLIRDQIIAWIRARAA